ncbi:MAG: O-antigen ligase family protein [Solirubrobacteraceae bacterium]|nr:O-antigen ligase family protein [Solirubrobacteraceae bacterium]
MAVATPADGQLGPLARGVGTLARAPQRPGFVSGLLTVGLALLLTAIAFGADGGLRLGRLTIVEIGVVLVGGGAVAVALLAAPAGQRTPGTTSIVLFGALAALTALSVGWSVEPSGSWLEANRTFAWFAAFAAAALLAHSARDGWMVLLGAFLIFGVLLCSWAIVTKLAPAQLSPQETYARLRNPYGYWNSVGLTGAMTIPCCLWLGARRHGHQAISALAYPALTIVVFALLLAYSRGALLAAALSCGVWFAVVPLRLRGVTVLAVGSGGALLMTLWAFSQTALTEDKIGLALRQTAGNQLAVLMVVVLIAVLAIGLGLSFLAARQAPRTTTRRTVGSVVIVMLLLAPIVALGALATSDKGLGGSISDGWTSLTDPNAVTPANDPSRLTAVGSVRARYWNEALKTFQDNSTVGVGAGGYAISRTLYRTDGLDVLHAHGYVVQILADLGIAGALVSLALLAAWLAAALRSCGLRRRDRGTPWTPERVGLVTLFTAVLVFGIHSFVDWTWYVPGNAVPAMLAAGWVAGRGALGTPAPTDGFVTRLRAGLHERSRLLTAGTVIFLAIVAAWATWQPWSANRVEQDALAALDRGDTAGATQLAKDAQNRNPLSLDPLFTLAAIRTAAGDQRGARRAYTDAVKLQPSNPRPWLSLAQFELSVGDAKAAEAAVRPALYLDPKSQEAAALYLQATGGVTETIPQPAGTEELEQP